MQVIFRTERLKRCYERIEEATRRWGGPVARRYIQRTGILYAAESAEDLYRMPSLDFHPLKGDRKGQFALTLVGRSRLIVTFPSKDQKMVQVEEVNEHYGD